MVEDPPVALVTGGAIRVGRAISRSLAEAGFRVAVNFRRSEKPARELVDELAAGGHEAVAHRADVARPDQVDALVGACLEHWSRLDLVVNNAAIFERRPLLEVDRELWERTLTVNLDGPFTVAHAAARHMWEAGGGRIVNICGVAGIEPLGEYAPYCVAKAGLDMLTRCMAEGLAPRVQVNGVAPGTVLFPEDTPETERREVVARIPAGRIGSPEDVAAAVVFLAGAPDYVTGTILTVDGGASLAS